MQHPYECLGLQRGHLTGRWYPLAYVRDGKACAALGAFDEGGGLWYLVDSTLANISTKMKPTSESSAAVRLVADGHPDVLGEVD